MVVMSVWYNNGRWNPSENITEIYLAIALWIFILYLPQACRSNKQDETLSQIYNNVCYTKSWDTGDQLH